MVRRPAVTCPCSFPEGPFYLPQTLPAGDASWHRKWLFSWAFSGMNRGEIDFCP